MDDLMHLGNEERLVKLAELKTEYPIGTRLQLTEELKDIQPISEGEKGTVRGIDDAGHILMAWDCSRSLSLFPMIDKFKKIEAE